MKSSNRIATIMICVSPPLISKPGGMALAWPSQDMGWLSAVEAGGSTTFIYANFSVPLVKNAALFWWNLRRNGNGDGDILHAGCPILVEDKWVANKWIHEHGQEFQRPCSADPED
ncbi:hypothetical protein DV515_00006676 [Chloebia gouldiae]|uniref:Uncharacterized protein n=1 Tax=Chloebia gouldiae TaxID=44316 RepID=A0A3L8SLG1_CHLGU|nr:hypothetical protein DV515_00006676 [Chloebia gouldiae]